MSVGESHIVGTLDESTLGTLTDIMINIVKPHMISLFRTEITNEFNDTLGGLVSTLGASGLEAAFAVPRFDGAGSTMVTFDAAISGVETTAARLLVGASSRFTAPAAHTRQPTRVPLPPGAVRLDPGGTQAVAVAEHVAVLQQALQANWRGGGLDGAVTAADGANVAFVTTLPPVVSVKADGSLAIDSSAWTRTCRSPVARPRSTRAPPRAPARASRSAANDDLLSRA